MAGTKVKKSTEGRVRHFPSLPALNRLCRDVASSECLGTERADLRLCPLSSPTVWDVESHSLGLFFPALPEEACASYIDKK